MVGLGHLTGSWRSHCGHQEVTRWSLSPAGSCGAHTVVPEDGGDTEEVTWWLLSPIRGCGESHCGPQRTQMGIRRRHGAPCHLQMLMEMTLPSPNTGDGIEEVTQGALSPTSSCAGHAVVPTDGDGLEEVTLWGSQHLEALRR